MNSIDRERIKHAANSEGVRRALIHYFVQKGFNESFDRLVNPLLIQDITIAIPVLSNKIDIEPHALEIDPTTGRATLGWNLFVLGGQRMYLGETTHRDLLQLAQQIRSGMFLQENNNNLNRCTTPRRIIYFIERVLSQHKAGMVDFSDGRHQMARAPRSARMAAASGIMSGEFYRRSGYGSALTT